MKVQPFVSFIPYLISLVLTGTCFGQPATRFSNSKSDTGAFFLYIDDCCMKFNPELGRQEFVIKARKLPAMLLKMIPLLRNGDNYSKRNCKIIRSQQRVIRQYKSEKILVSANKSKFKLSYPQGLKHGWVVGADEFNSWDFYENPVPSDSPDPGTWQYYKFHYYKWIWYRSDPMNIQYGLRTIS